MALLLSLKVVKAKCLTVRVKLCAHWISICLRTSEYGRNCFRIYEKCVAMLRNVSFCFLTSFISCMSVCKIEDCAILIVYSSFNICSFTSKNVYFSIFNRPNNFKRKLSYSDLQLYQLASACVYQIVMKSNIKYPKLYHVNVSR